MESTRESYGPCLTGAGTLVFGDTDVWVLLTNSTARNTQGTLNYQTRIHKFAITLTPVPGVSVANPSPPNLQLKYLDTILLTGPDGTPTTSLDPDASGSITYPGFPILPVATYSGDGFGGKNGTGGKRISIDGEGLVLNKDGTFWVSDEYGPYIYKFSATGRMLQAIMPPGAYIPQRNGTVSFSANSPPIYDPNRKVTPKDPLSGRNNNQGLEALTKSADGKTLYALLQSALNQEGGPNNPYRRQVRLLEYDITGIAPVYTAEYVVTLPYWVDPTVKSGTNGTKVAAQSEIESLGDDRFLILSRDSGNGHGQASSLSIYRHVDIFSVDKDTGATNIKSAANDAIGGSIASATGDLKPGIKPAVYCSFLDFNLNSELNKFGLHNGGAQDAGLLNEKWESLALAPVDANEGRDGEWFLFSLSDNDFITQNGTLKNGTYPYKDASGYNLDNQALVFQVKLPRRSQIG